MVSLLARSAPGRPRAASASQGRNQVPFADSPEHAMMTHEAPVPMVRCRLDGSDDCHDLRYVPASEFELWRHLMASQHGRPVTVEEVSVWLAEDPAILDE